MKAERERSEKSIQAAIKEFLAARQERLGGSKSVDNYRQVLGRFDDDHHAPRTPRHPNNPTGPSSLMSWLRNYNAGLSDKEKITLLAQLDGSILRKWRQSWDCASSTKKQRWQNARSFLTFCFNQGWFAGKPNPANSVDQVAMGDDAPATGILSDEQWDAFVGVAEAYAPEGISEMERQTWILRQITFWQLVRWTGMALADAVNFDTSAISDNGKFIYHRWKLRKKPLVGWATVRVPQHVRDLLKICPPERDAVSKTQLFRSRGVTLHSLTQRWRERFKTVCDVAGITEIQTGVRGRMQQPHPHALRDTFAVWMLRKTRNVKAVSKMLGHANSIITETSYLPWVKELEEAHLEICDEALSHIVVPKKAMAKVVGIK